MNEIVHYKVFKNDDELTQFQKDNSIGIVLISPFTQGVKMDYDTKDMTGAVSIGVFVVYFNRKS